MTIDHTAMPAAMFRAVPVALMTALVLAPTPRSVALAQVAPPARPAERTAQAAATYDSSLYTDPNATSSRFKA
ncbi:MAG: hypothetical protein ACHQQ3_04720, partial [Gemmatimonadales bacterium]